MSQDLELELKRLNLVIDEIGKLAFEGEEARSIILGIRELVQIAKGKEDGHKLRRAKASNP